MPTVVEKKNDTRPIRHFKILAGTVAVGNPIPEEKATDPEYVPTVDLYGPLDKDGKLHPNGPCGDVVPSRSDLVKKHGTDKFQEVFDQGSTEPTDEYDAMTIEELHVFAEKNEIDLGRATSQKGIAGKVRQAMEG